MILIVNGPNLNLTGRREPEIYGTRTFESYLEGLRAAFPGVELEYFQSNHEGELIDRIQQSGYDPRTEGIILNPGALAHYSYAIADAVRGVPVPVVEVHISNIFAREEFRSRSVTAAACAGVVSGFGLRGYEIALSGLLESPKA